MKEVDIYGKIKQNITTRDDSKYSMEVNARNRYNILAVVNVKGGNFKPVKFITVETTASSFNF